MISQKLLNTLKGIPQSIPPIWFMRQAGRHLPEYRQVRAAAGSFMDLCYNPELAAEVTLQPVRRYDVDAAIVFADILLIPDGLGQKLWFEAGEGPKLDPVLTDETIEQLSLTHVMDKVSPVFETLERVRAELSEEKSLIGFAGAPWTVATYMIAGQGSKDPAALRGFAYENPETFSRLIEMLIKSTSDYLIAQVKAGADAVQLFDSWASGLPEPFFQQACLKPTLEIARRVKAVCPDIPFIAFPRGSGPLMLQFKDQADIDGIGLDSGIPWDWARQNLSPDLVVQGGLDPLLVKKGGHEMIDQALRLKETFDEVPYIFNLGHGFDPATPPENVAALIQAIRQ